MLIINEKALYKPIIGSDGNCQYSGLNTQTNNVKQIRYTPFSNLLYGLAIDLIVNNTNFVRFIRFGKFITVIIRLFTYQFTLYIYKNDSKLIYHENLFIQQYILRFVERSGEKPDLSICKRIYTNGLFIKWFY